MSERPFISDATIDRVKLSLRRRAFATKLRLQQPQRTIVLDRKGVALAPLTDVVVEWANLQPGESGTDTVDVLTVYGELQRWESLDAKTGDLFMIDGRQAEIVSPVVVDDGVAVARFALMGGR